MLTLSSDEMKFQKNPANPEIEANTLVNSYILVHSGQQDFQTNIDSDIFERLYYNFHKIL